MKIFNIIKLNVFGILGIFILIFNQTLVNNYIGLVVGCAMILEALFNTIYTLIESKHNKNVERHEFYNDVAQILLGILTIVLFKNSLEKVCIIWGTWEIIFQTIALIKYIDNAKHCPFLVESVNAIILIVLSVFLLIDVHHAELHIIVLGVEFILQTVFFIINHFLKKRRDKLNCRDKLN